MQNENLTPLLTISEAAKEAKVSRQAIYVAIKLGRLTAHQYKRHWFINKADLDFYRENKYIGDHRKRDGKRIFDLDKGVYSVHQVSKFLSMELGRPYTMNRVYYLLNRGDIKAMRNGAAWVILKEEAIKLVELEKGREAAQAKKYA